MSDIFIGRSSTIEEIDKLLIDTKNHILPIVSKGGAGKTWLLKRLRDRYLDKIVLEEKKGSLKPMCSIWTDFGETRFHSFLNITLEWLNQLQEYIPISDSRTYRIKASKLTTFSHEFKTSKEMRLAEKETFAYFSSILAKISYKRRILVLLDTVEASPSLNLDEQVYRFVSRLSNIVLVLAGRPEASLFQELPKFNKVYSHDWIIHPNIQLRPFSPEDVQEYFVEALGTELDIDFCRQIKLLTAGNPVLVAITSEWLKNNIALPDYVQTPSTDTGALKEGDLKIKQDKFEFDLLSNARKLQSPLDWILLYAAFLNRRSDPKLFELVIDSENEASFNEAFEKFNKLVFVRRSLTSESGRLHDEAERLILKHVWPIVDPDGELRMDLAQTIVEKYYKTEIDKLVIAKREYLGRNIEEISFSTNELDLQNVQQLDTLVISENEFRIPVLQTECLDYQFRISEKEGWSYLEKLIQEATVESSNIQSIFIEQAIYKLKLKEKNKIRALLALSRVRLIQKNNQQAELLAEKAQELLLKKHSFNQEDFYDEAVIKIILGMVETKTIHKISILEDAQETAEKTKDHLLDAKTFKQLGLAYRQQGNWRRSIQAYDAALKLLDQKEDPDEYAAVLNNLAFVLLLNGKPFQADSMVEKALYIRKQRTNLHGLSLSYSTKGRIVEALGDYARARRYYNQAADLALQRNDGDFYALCKINLATSEITERNFDAARELVKPGMDCQSTEVRARAFHQAAKIELMEGKRVKEKGNINLADSLYSKAKNFAEIALDIAHSMLNYPLEGAIIYDLALIEYLQNNREAKYHLERLEKILKNFDLRLEKGRLEELRGDLKYSNGAVLEAFQFYIKACRILADYNPASFYDTFERVRSKFLECTLENKKAVSILINESIPDAHPRELMAALRQISNDQYDYPSGHWIEP